ncbi:hypothetical protein OTK49_02930 [Vibrio coralliirubri]|uniref:hypothetical protein n=1 Tax=Vibrio coralliirubri TaxID=1516159 RepID=UPI002284E515|nr:hypothetical protein [Vibrio coralliirubri]MCY9861469.1 hypothetical protein [Vibrio coralliirubri]
MYKVTETFICRYCSRPAEAAAQYFGCLESELHSDDSMFWVGNLVIMVTDPNDGYSYRIEVLEELNENDFEKGFQKRRES